MESGRFLAILVMTEDGFRKNRLNRAGIAGAVRVLVYLEQVHLYVRISSKQSFAGGAGNDDNWVGSGRVGSARKATPSARPAPFRSTISRLMPRYGYVGYSCLGAFLLCRHSRCEMPNKIFQIS